MEAIIYVCTQDIERHRERGKPEEEREKGHEKTTHGKRKHCTA
jgi:hypothetical protein